MVNHVKMGLLVFVRNLLLALCLFLVLGFLYYSAWKLHLLQWEDSSKYGHCSSRQACSLPVAAMPVGSSIDTSHPPVAAGQELWCFPPSSICMLWRVSVSFTCSVRMCSSWVQTSHCTRISSSWRLLSFFFLISQMHPTLTSRLLPWGLVFELVYFSVLRTLIFPFTCVLSLVLSLFYFPWGHCLLHLFSPLVPNLGLTRIPVTQQLPTPSLHMRVWSRVWRSVPLTAWPVWFLFPGALCVTGMQLREWPHLTPIIAHSVLGYSVKHHTGNPLPLLWPFCLILAWFRKPGLVGFFSKPVSFLWTAPGCQLITHWSRE